MDQVSQVREKTDIVALISEFIPLKKAGRNFKSACPFHSDKTPSFVVSPERQIWHCFGCNKGGDAFTFLMEYERLEFPEALRILAQKAGIELRQQHFDAGVVSKKEKIYQINNIAAQYYHFVLTEHPIGKKALEYLTQQRKLLPQTIRTFKLGFAPGSSNALLQYLMQKKKYPRDDLFEAGLISRQSNGLVDFFQGRIMFPLYDHRENIIGFAGRVLTSQKQSKYINTRETLVYHKGQVFFGLNIAKEAIKKANQVIIMEGELDVIASFQEGINNAVAVKGTALTEEQVNLIARYAQRVTLCFDMDSAGQEALKRSLVLLEKKGLRTTVIQIPEGKDADEAIKTNPIAFKKAVKEDIDVYEYLLQQMLQKHNPKTIEGKRSISESLLPIFARIQNEVVKEHYLTKLSNELSTSIEALEREVERIEKKEIVGQEVETAKIRKSREEVLELYLLALLVQDDKPIRHLDGMKKMIDIYKFSLPAYQKIIELLLLFSKTQEIFNPKQFVGSLPAELVPTFDQCFLMPIPKFKNSDEYAHEIQKVAEELYGLFVHKQIKLMGEMIKQKETNGDLKELEELQHQLSHLVSLLKKK